MNTHITLLNESDEKYLNKIDVTSILLKQHQLTSLYRCIEMENIGVRPLNDNYVNVRSTIGILADNVGSGKSYVILTLLLVNKEPLISFNRINVYGENNLFIEYKKYKHKELLDLNIIVCSFGLIEQWEKYIKCFNNFNLQIVNKTTLLRNFEKTYKNCNLLLISASFYQHVVSFLNINEFKVKRVIFDEADSSSTPGSKHVSAIFYWFVTASYKNLLYPYPTYHFTSQNIIDNRRNRVQQLATTGILKNSFIKNLFVKLVKTLPYIDNRLLYDLVVKNDDEYIKLSFNLPKIKMFYIECVDNLSNILNGITNNYTILSAVNAGDLKTAISVLQKDNKGDEAHILNLVKSDLNKNLQNCLCTINYYESIISQNETQQREKIIKLRQEEDDLNGKIKMLEERINKNLCVICYCPPEKKTLTKCCNNSFCFKCICTWVQYKKNCPFCRKNINELDEDLLVIDEEDNEEDNDQDCEKENLMKMNKLDTLGKLLEYIRVTFNNVKTLIFSAYDGSFPNISKVLIKQNINYGFLNGIGLKNTYIKYKDLNSGLDTLMINSTSFGSGLNLENTTDIILFHNFDYQIENQVIGRAQRPGRKSSLRVWYLFNDSEILQNDHIDNEINKTRFVFKKYINT